MYIFTEENWDIALLHALIALNASIVLNFLFTSCHLIHLFCLHWPLCWPHGLSRLTFHICSPECYEPLVTPDPWSHLTLATFPSACDGPALQTDGGHYLRLLSDCLWEIADWVVGVLHQDICLWTMRRPKFRWGHILSGFIRSGVLVSLLPPWQTRKWLTISQDLMSYPLEFPWFLEIKFLLLIDERNFNQSSIWHFRSSNFSVAKTTQIPVCQ